MKRVLVTGGAGFIGSHMVKRLARAGWETVSYDNLSYGNRDAVVAGELVVADLLDGAALRRVFEAHRFDLVMHFAASAQVAESFQDPRKYYSNNLMGALSLVHAMLDAGVSRLVFSSTCATYGVPDKVPVTEDQPQRPLSPYGTTKLAVERALADYGAAHGLESIALRYFNAAGADHDGELSERHEPETRLIPLALREAARVEAGGDREATTLVVAGDDYPTPDGTCIRDYIHVDDLCEAHMLAAQHVLGGALAGGGLACFNLGNGAGYSVLEVIAAVRAVTGVDVAYRVAARRPGDPPALTGSGRKAEAVLGFRPRTTRIEDIVATAWRAMKRRV